MLIREPEKEAGGVRGKETRRKPEKWEGSRCEREEGEWKGRRESEAGGMGGKEARKGKEVV